MIDRLQHCPFPLRAALCMCVVLITVSLFGCSSGGSDKSTTSGNSFTPPSTVLMSSYSSANAVGTPAANIDISSVSQGYVAAAGVSTSRLKFQVKKDDVAYNYDMPKDGTPMVAPLNMGNGTYTFTILQNTTENRYLEVFSITTDVTLENEFVPFLRPNIFCNYTADGTVAAKARELVANAQNEGDALQAIYEWIVNNVTYDKAKASELAGKTGYIPNPQSTLETQTGICFDYASLAAAMLRSQGIPCKIITGYVSPNGIYHAWNMVWINGSWKTVTISVDPKTWTRVDTTFAAGGDTTTVGDGSKYEDRYIY